MRSLAFFSLISLAFSCFATTHVDIYHAEVAVNEKISDDMARIEGMKSVVIKATGDKHSVKNAIIEKALSQNSQYLSQIGYGKKEKHKTLKMVFSEKQIGSLLTQAQLPFWPAQRETILIWFVEDKDFQRSIVWENVSNPEINKLKALSEERGIPVIIPVGDFDDITGIDPSDVWGNFMQPISRASQRYHPDAVLVLRAHNNNFRWSLYDQVPDEMMNFSSVPVTGSASGDNALETLVDQLTHYYANKNAVVVHSQSSLMVKISVTGVSRATSFFALENALNQLSSVASVDISGIQGDTVSYQIHLLTSQKEFEQELMGVSLIEKDPANEDTAMREMPDEPAGTTEAQPAGEKRVETKPSEESVGQRDNTVQQDVQQDNMEQEDNTDSESHVSELFYHWKQ
ncbi:hypothetical protein VA7868_00640 [Vibrio aerogenes CECT 7868]|uniref:DUF2066 domain-containing protein n=1 Tax=Vibrio aerogenes CECT 7868 TaxID=1216006 RepID=A0A1M5W915_9VIBR|nr:DUF2066 domain-containing protein [Vibrio aerogenes]SHH84069.1 hypothetical protein VA7868_00640 [Vibrio aerogenes CECT 7868]